MKNYIHDLEQAILDLPPDVFNINYYDMNTLPDIEQAISVLEQEISYIEQEISDLEQMISDLEQESAALGQNIRDLRKAALEQYYRAVMNKLQTKT